MHARRRGAGLVVALLLAVTSTVRAERLPIRGYTIADGLANNSIFRIVRDSRGFLWFCTSDGLSRFDGYTFMNFGSHQGLTETPVNDLLETRSGGYWIATGTGLIRFDPEGGNTMFSAVASDPAAQAPGHIERLREGHDGTLWVAASNGLYRLDRTSDRLLLRRVEIGLPNDFPEHREVLDVMEDSGGTLWIATPSGLYRRWTDGTAVRYLKRDGLPGEFIHGLFEDHHGRLWVTTRDAGFFRLRIDTDPRAKPAVDFQMSASDGLRTMWAIQTFETSDGRFWVATAFGLAELLQRDAAKPTLRVYGTRNGLFHEAVTSLNEDLAGNLWLGSFTAGAMKVARGGFTTFGEQDGIHSAYAILEDAAGHVCFKANVLGDGVHSVFEGIRLDLVGGAEPYPVTRFGCYGADHFTWFSIAALEDWGWVLEGITLRARNGEWWVGAGSGLYRFAPTPDFQTLTTARPLSVFTTQDGLAARATFRLFEDSRGDIWISTIATAIRGLSRWERNTGRLINLAGSPGLPSLVDDTPRSFGEDRSGNVWIAFNSGLVRATQDRFTFFSARDGLPQGAILDMHVDPSGRLWLASSYGGLIRVDRPDAEHPAFVTYTTEQGLSSNNVIAIAEDRDGYLYVGGGHGLDRLDPLTSRVEHFTAADGLPLGRVIAAYCDRQGTLWFGTSNGIARLVPSHEPVRRAPPPMFITGLRVTGIARAVSARGAQAVSLPDLPPRDNQLEIDFVGLEFGAGDDLRYQYQLEGASTEWSNPTAQRTVTYASLAAGRYTFKVRALTSQDVVSTVPAVLTFTVLRPVWQRWWFLTLTALAVGGSAYGAFRYRVARLLEMANMRTHIATDLHDDIGANLTRIAVLSEVARQRSDTAPLGSIARIARESVGSMSDIVWAINPKREALVDLTRRMRQHADEVFTSRGVALVFEAPAEAVDVRLGIDVRRDLLLIFKEAVNNAARHSRCMAVRIGLRIDGSHLTLTIADDGEGFDAAAIASDGQGLGSMERRAKRIRGTLTIASAPGNGCAIALTVPV